MNDVRRCSDCGEDHAGHHDRTEMSRSGAGLSVRPCDPSVGGGKTFGGTVVKRSVRTAAENYYRDCRSHHENVCIPNGAGYIDPRALPTPPAAQPAVAPTRGVANK